MSRTNKFFLAGLPLMLVLAGGVLYLSSWSARDTEVPCGCGPPPAEATGEYEETDERAIFNGQPVDYQLAKLVPSLEAIKEGERVLGETAEEKWIEIDLSEQRLYAHEGNKIVYEIPISGGKWAPTPTGEFRIWIKLKYTKMSGGVRGTGTYYYLPNVPYTQYFYKGYGLHGTYWHNNFGHPMSHGCVNLPTPEAEKLFYWTSPPVPQDKGVVYPSKDHPGTRVVIHT